MSTVLRDTLLRQYDIAWRLTAFHLDGLGTDDCLWRPADQGLHVRLGADGRWQPDWPEHERYDLGPSSLGWLTWHLGFWWSMALDHAFGPGALTREAVQWPGTGEGVRDWIHGLDARWRAALAPLDDADLASPARTRWPFRDRPFGDLVAWANVELAKSAAEIGYVRFLRAARPAGRYNPQPPRPAPAAP